MQICFAVYPEGYLILCVKTEDPLNLQLHNNYEGKAL